MSAVSKNTKRSATQRAFESTAKAIVGLIRIVEIAVDERDLSVAQYRLLGFCALEPTSPSEIATWLSVRQQNVTRQIDSLVELGYLHRSADHNDRRRVVLEASESGRTVLNDVEQTIDTYITVLLGKLEPAEAQQVREGIALAGTAMTRAWEYAKQPGRPEPRGRLHRPT